LGRRVRHRFKDAAGGGRRQLLCGLLLGGASQFSVRPATICAL
jgi:hypothetical protein